jgi:hypothetical protein
MSRPAGAPVNKAFAEVMAGVAITLAGLIALGTVLAMLFNPMQWGWDYAWFLVRSVLLIGFLVLSFRYFLSRSRQVPASWNRDA